MNNTLLTSVCVLIIILGYGARLLKLRLERNAGELVIQRFEVGDQNSDTKLKVAQLSDIHYKEGEAFLNEALTRAVNFIEKEQPDVIVLTGDYVQRDHPPSKQFSDKWIPIIKSVSTAPILATLGNHDRFYPSQISHNLSVNGVTMLQNEKKIIKKNGIEFHIVGLADVTQPEWSKAKETIISSINEMEDESQLIILSHNPDSAKLINNWVVSHRTQTLTTVSVTILSGHTHGGQICFPNGTPVLSKAKLFFDYLPNFFMKFKYARLGKVVRNWNWASGKHNLSEDVTLIVSRGVGAHQGIRLFCPPDVTIIEFC